MILIDLRSIVGMLAAICSAEATGKALPILIIMRFRDQHGFVYGNRILHSIAEPTFFVCLSNLISFFAKYFMGPD